MDDGRILLATGLVTSLIAKALWDRSTGSRGLNNPNVFKVSREKLEKLHDPNTNAQMEKARRQRAREWNQRYNAREYRVPPAGMAKAPEAGPDIYELVMVIENDGDLYTRFTRKITQSLAKKLKKGVFDRAKAAKAFEHLVKMAEQFGRIEPCTAADRRAASWLLLEAFTEEIELTANEL